MKRHEDGSAGDVDYRQVGGTYAAYRRPDPRIAAVIEQALGSAKTVLNVGAGAGAYEPTGRAVAAVEPSASMRAQRGPSLPAAIDAAAEALPFADDSFDAAMTTFSVHQWRDLDAGLTEMRRVARGVVLVLTCDPERVERFWLGEYAPEVLAVEARRYPAISRISAALGANSDVRPVPIPLDCTDGFQEAYYGRPEMFLRADARKACSAWSFVEPAVHARMEARLHEDLARGRWDERHGRLRSQPTYDGSLQLIVGR
jgi:hypothetical protein